MVALFRRVSRATSACKQHFQRLLSFRSTDDTSATEEEVELDDVEAPPKSATIMTTSTLETEKDSSKARENHPFYKRVGKAAQPVALFLAGTSVVLFMNPPQGGHIYILVGYTSSIYLSFCMGGGLSIYSMFWDSSPAAAWLQLRTMVVGIGSILIAVVLRSIIFITPVSPHMALLVVFLMLGVPMAVFSSLALVAAKLEGDGA